MTKPNIIISSADAKKLEELLEKTTGNDPTIVALEDEIMRAEVREPCDIPANVVTMNSKVRFKMLPAGDEFVLTLVYPQNSQKTADTISVLAPVGSALLGLAEGDEIDWPKPDGRVLRVRIAEVIAQPERDGDF